MTKMTYVDALNLAIANLTAEKYTNGDVTTNGDELREKLTALRDAQAKRNSTSSGKQTKKQQANADLAAHAYAVLLTLDKPVTVSELMAADREVLGAPNMTPQKVSPLMKKLVDEGKVERLIEKRKSYFRVAE